MGLHCRSANAATSEFRDDVFPGKSSVHQCPATTVQTAIDTPAHLAVTTPIVYNLAMEFALSSDGTRIAFERSGDGPPLVLVHGTTADHTRWSGILPELTQFYSVFAMDRRGRGESGDGDSYSLEYEFDDVAAIVGAAGKNVNLLGHSYGALCAMEAALRVNNLGRLVLYEPAFPTRGKPLYPPGVPERLRSMFDAGDKEAFLVTFFRDVVGVPADQISGLRADPSWPARIRAAHTVLREMADADYRFEPDRFRDLKVPTLLLVGEKSPDELTAPARALGRVLPNSQVAVLKGQGHIAMTTAPDIFLQAVKSFLASKSG